MPSIISGYEYDIFISYRQKDNHSDQWVTKFIKVISRNSVKVFKGQPLNVKEIAEKLGVSAILEGSVRKSGNRVRITAQLINAQTDEHIWADIFERELTDIFQVGKGSVKYNN